MGWHLKSLSGKKRVLLELGGNAVAIVHEDAPLDWAREASQRGAGEILLTSMDRDGTNEGYDLPLTAAVAGAVGVPVIASGGAGELEHLAQALRAGADAVLCASIFHYGHHTVAEAKQHLAAAGIPVREA